jgi:hypothetical protein
VVCINVFWLFHGLRSIGMRGVVLALAVGGDYFFKILFRSGCERGVLARPEYPCAYQGPHATIAKLQAIPTDQRNAEVADAVAIGAVNGRLRAAIVSWGLAWPEFFVCVPEDCPAGYRATASRSDRWIGAPAGLCCRRIPPAAGALVTSRQARNREAASAEKMHAKVMALPP